jgi:hypothetical protein
MKMFAIGVIVLVSLDASSHVSECAVGAFECTNCAGTMHMAYNNSPCITVTWDSPQSVTSGSCNQTSCTQILPCKLGGSVTIANSGPSSCGNHYVRTRIDASCGPTVMLGSGQEGDTEDYGDMELKCGTYYQVVIYATDTQASNCAASGVAGFGWTCLRCQAVH